MNMDPKEFWRLAKEINPNTKKPAHKKYHSASMCIDEHPPHGPGANGGGRICICENCGDADWTASKNKNFCSPKCRSEYYSRSRTPTDSTLIRKRGKIEKVCCFCGATFIMPMHKLQEGTGIFCSSKCANHARGFIPLWYTCNTCGAKFRSITDWGSRFCCKECAEKKPIIDENENYFASIPKLVYPEDKFDHVINTILEKMMIKAQKEHKNIFEVSISMSLRMKAINGKLNQKIEKYYLTKREQRVLQAMDLLITDESIYEDDQ